MNAPKVTDNYAQKTKGNDKNSVRFGNSMKKIFQNPGAAYFDLISFRKYITMVMFHHIGKTKHNFFHKSTSTSVFVHVNKKVAQS